MSNTVPATAFTAAPVTPAPASVAQLPLTAEAPATRPQLTVVAPQDPVVAQKPAAPAGAPTQVAQADVPPELPELLRLYRAQQRECWLCKKIAGSIDSGKEPSEDDRWHFTTCVLSWAHL